MMLFPYQPPEEDGSAPRAVERKKRSRLPWLVIGAIVGAALMPTFPGQTESGTVFIIVVFVLGGTAIGAVFEVMACDRSESRSARNGWKIVCLSGLAAVPMVFMWALLNAYGERVEVLASVLFGAAGLAFVIGGIGWLATRR